MFSDVLTRLAENAADHNEDVQVHGAGTLPLMSPSPNAVELCDGVVADVRDCCRLYHR